MVFHREPNTYVGEVNLKVANVEKSTRFYQEVIGFQILEQSESKATLTADGKSPLLSLEQPIDVVHKQPNTTGLYHFALLLPNRSDLADIVIHFSRMGIRFGSSDHL